MCERRADSIIERRAAAGMIVAKRAHLLDGNIVNWEDAKVHVLCHALNYGTGVFEEKTSAEIEALTTKKGNKIMKFEEFCDFLEGKDNLYVEFEMTPSQPEDFYPEDRLYAYVEKIYDELLAFCLEGFQDWKLPVLSGKEERACRKTDQAKNQRIKYGITGDSEYGFYAQRARTTNSWLRSRDEAY